METGNSDFCTSSISDSERAFSQFVDEHNASLLAKAKFNLNPDSLEYSKFLENCKPAAIFVEDFCRRYEIGELGGEGQGILCDALLSIHVVQIRKEHRRYFVRVLVPPCLAELLPAHPCATSARVPGADVAQG